MKTKNARLLSLAFAMLCFTVLSGFRTIHSDTRDRKDQQIMLALLLDTSNSMDGLIDQAKSQLWKIVNELAAAKCDDGSRPRIKIALYEYGNDGLSSEEGYIRQVSGLTDDLDLISEKLFALSTNGGNEFCGQVIRTSLDQLVWSAADADLKMIFIAGNEPFTQGPVSFRSACAVAKEKGVIVNTIFCGDFDEGIRTNWKSGADLTGGSYMSIEQNRRTVYIPTPYDKQLDACNERLNKTYVYYGPSGSQKKEAQATEDKNAESYGLSNKAERTISKGSHAYKNSSWDLVDAAKDGDGIISETPAAQLPEEMRSMSPQERKDYVAQKGSERAKIQNEIQELNKKRQAFIASHHSKAEDSMLDAALIKAIREKAKGKNLVWE